MEKTHLRVNTWKGTLKIFAFTTVLFAFINRTLYLTASEVTFGLTGKRSALCTVFFCFIVALNTASLSHDKPASAGTSPDSCPDQDNDKRNTLYTYILVFPMGLSVANIPLLQSRYVSGKHYALSLFDLQHNGNTTRLHYKSFYKAKPNFLAS